MYTEEDLKKYPFFEKKLKDTEIRWMLDPLTGVLARGTYLEMINAMINENIPFTFGIMDLDNFKFINDNYGHHIGDEVLKDISSKLAEFLGDDGLVGRFGGDEFLFMIPKTLSYTDKKELLGRLYENDQVLRRNIHLPSCDPFITATIGCSSFPEDAQDFDTLFDVIDKVLYRGKVKGRNCYIIYVEEKHKNIEIKKIAKQGIYTSLHRLIRQFEMVPGLRNKLESVFPMLMDELRLSDLYFIDNRNVIRSVRKSDLAMNVGSLRRIMGDDHYAVDFVENCKEEIREKCPKFVDFLDAYDIETLLIIRIGMDLETFGYIVCAEPASHRIWQEEEMALIYFLAKLIAARVVIDGEPL
ncbi:MAG TPA: hypothetical protein DCY81_07795 [Lachnospiraceae bacterium]|nr:hypothetical protein [Lachnospiraceae bacterium]